MPFPVSYSLEYDRVRGLLSPGERLLLGVIEDEIAHDPDPRLKGRFEDHGYIYETQPEDFLVECRLLENGWILFERLIDLRGSEPLMRRSRAIRDCPAKNMRPALSSAHMRLALFDPI